MDYRCRVRCLDRDALEEAVRDGKDLFGADPEYKAYMRALAEDRL